jgi:hypothetical protein
VNLLSFFAMSLLETMLNQTFAATLPDPSGITELDVSDLSGPTAPDIILTVLFEGCSSPFSILPRRREKSRESIFLGRLDGGRKGIPPAWNKCSGERGHSYSLVKYAVTRLTVLLSWLVRRVSQSCSFRWVWTYQREASP